MSKIDYLILEEGSRTIVGPFSTKGEARFYATQCWADGVGTTLFKKKDNREGQLAFIKTKF